ncbi:MAG: hypothetical protein HF978_16420 [Desulfobacteraceae bacterium]|nr:hypothetical protein [Desulfobacteraceae bacterium]MBC2757129.1 hypothetical protein [Desulfobacteraceae bacterium]
MAKTTNQTPATNQDQSRGFLLYNRRPALSEHVLESLKEAEAITGINQSELRMRLMGLGIGALNINRCLNELEDCAADLRFIGLNTTAVTKEYVKNGKLPPAARHINLTDSTIKFLDANENTLFKITKESELLIIITDLSGKTVKHLMTAMAYTGNAINKTFDEILKKFSIAKPAAIFYSLNGDSENGVYVDSDIFSYMGLNDKLTHSKGSNFRVMVKEAMAMSKSSITDENFGISLLPGANPEWSRGKSPVEKELGRYTRYILTAVEKKLLPFEAESNEASDEETSPSLSGDKPGTYPSNKNLAGMNSSKGLQPPPNINYSKITSFFQTSLPELIVGLIVIVSPFSFFMSGVKSISAHQVFWKMAAGSAIVLAGVLMFCYSLLLLYYRRMVENTPTSKIRSLSMGMVELSGKSRLYYDLRTSATKTQCVYYRCRYYKYQQTNDGSRWALTRSVSSGKIPFYIEDDTGRVLIKPKGAIFNIPMATQSFQGSYIPTLSIQLHDPNTKVVEELIPERARLYVLGSAQVEKHGKKTREIIIDKLRMLKQSPKIMSEYDINSDGQIDVEEWEAARSDVERMVYAESLANGPGDSESVVIEKPRFGLLPFIIADSEKNLIRKLMFRTWIFLFGGLSTMGFSLNFLVNFFR